jgi:hypothetical protein
MVFITVSSSKIPSNSDSTTRSGALRVWETFRFAVMIYVGVGVGVGWTTTEEGGGREGVSCMLGSGTPAGVWRVYVCGPGGGTRRRPTTMSSIIVKAAGKGSTQGWWTWTYHALRPPPLHAGHTHRQRRGDDLHRYMCVRVCVWVGVR